MATVKGTAKVDKFTVNTSNVIVVTGKKPSTNKISKNGKNKIYGAAAKDTFTVKGGKLNYIYGDAGNDTITVTSKIGSGNRIYGDDAKNKVSGNDTFNINGGSKNYFYGGKGVDTFNINGGTTNYIYGGAGKDTFVFGKKKATATIKDYAAGQDTLKVNSRAITSTTVKSKDVTLKAGSASVTLTGAATKVVSIKDSRGSYTVSNTAIKLGKDFTGTIDASRYLPTVKTIDGRAATKSVNITGNARDNIIYASKAGGTIKGGSGKDTIYAGSGKDTLYGGTDNDTFAYASGNGNDVIKDYAADQDTVYVSSGSISKTELVNSNKDVKFTIGSGSLTVNDATDKSISLKDSRGSYTASKTDITLNSDFTGKMDAGKYLSTVTTVNGKSTTKTVTVIGNTKDNIISGGSGYDRLYGYEGNDKLYGYGDNDYMYGGDGNDYLYGGTGNDALYGGAGKDTFVYANGDGSDAVKDYKTGSDTLYISSGSISKTALANSNKDLVFTVGSGSITLQNAATKAISLKDSRGSYTASSTAITLGKDFRGTMDAAIFLSTVETIDGSNAVNSVNITGNAQDNIIYAGKAGGTINGDAGADTIRIKSGSGFVIDSGDGNDNIYVDGGSVKRIVNSGGTDYIEIGKSAGSGIKVESVGSDPVGYKLVAKETVKVLGGSDHDIRLYGGNDKVIVAGGSGHVIYTDGPTGSGDAGGNDIIVIQDGGTVKKIVAGNGDDVIAVANGAGDGSVIYTGLEDPAAQNAGTGSNTVNLLGGSGHTVYLGGTRNTVMIESQNVVLNTCKGTTDNITVRWSEQGTGTLRINCSYDYGKDTEKSTLRLEGVNSNDFSFSMGTVQIKNGTAYEGYAGSSLIMKFTGNYTRDTRSVNQVADTPGTVYYQVPSGNEPNNTEYSRLPVYVNTNGQVLYNWCQGNERFVYDDTPVVTAAEMTEATGVTPTLEIARWGMHKAFSGITFDNGTFTFDQVTTAANNHSVLL